MIFGAEPTKGRAHQGFIVRLKSFGVFGDDQGEVITAHELLQGFQSISDRFHDVGVDAARRTNLLVNVRHPPFDDAGKRPSFGFGASREVLHQRGVQAAGLAPRAVQAPVGGDVGLSDDELAIQGDHPGEVEKEALSGSVSSDDESHGRAAALDPPEVVEYGGHFVSSPDLKMTEANPRHDPRAEGLKDRIAFTGLDRTTHDGSMTRCE